MEMIKQTMLIILNIDMFLIQVQKLLQMEQLFIEYLNFVKQKQRPISNGMITIMQMVSDQRSIS
ncbi:MAG: hypothetical protein OSJ73_25490 [Lachnospiraceae bacterium]|nr:hypothetical protein [Lachnospiraceae bacterium]